MTVHVTPLHDRVLVRRLEEEEIAKGGIIIPDTAKEKPQDGEVMAVGAGKIEKGQRIPLDVKVAIGFCSANTPATTSRSMTRSTRSSARMKSW